MPALQSSMYTMTSLAELTKRHITMPLEHLRDWKPFQIDALGLVTLLGADEVNQSVGTLHHRRYTEYLPLLAAFVIAGDRFVAEQPGFVLYNLTDGITSTELQGWLTRWLMSQQVNNATTVLEWKPNKQPRSWRDSVAPLLSFILVMPLLVITVLVGDWYGVGNAAAIIISIVTRVYLLSQRRHARDTDAGAPKDPQDAEMENPEKAHDTGAAAPEDADEEPPKKILCIIRSDGKMVTCKVPGSVLNTFVKHSKVKHEKLYHGARWLCWLALGVHMCILGMCSLFTQIYTVFLLVLSTWWFTSDFPWDIRREKENNVPAPGSSVFRLPFNRNWTVEQIDHPKETDGAKVDKRQYAWARLDLDAGAEEALKAWNLFPIDAKNKDWLKTYRQLKESLRDYKRTAATLMGQSVDARPTIITTQSTDPLTGGGLSPSAAPGSSPSQNSTSDFSVISSLDDTPRVPAGD